MSFIQSFCWTASIWRRQLHVPTGTIQGFCGTYGQRPALPGTGRQVQDQHILSHVLPHFRQHIDARQVTHVDPWPMTPGSLEVGWPMDGQQSPHFNVPKQWPHGHLGWVNGFSFGYTVNEGMAESLHRSKKFTVVLLLLFYSSTQSQESNITCHNMFLLYFLQCI